MTTKGKVQNRREGGKTLKSCQPVGKETGGKKEGAFIAQVLRAAGDVFPRYRKGIGRNAVGKGGGKVRGIIEGKSESKHQPGLLGGGRKKCPTPPSGKRRTQGEGKGYGFSRKSTSERVRGGGPAR